MFIGLLPIQCKHNFFCVCVCLLLCINRAYKYSCCPRRPRNLWPPTHHTCFFSLFTFRRSFCQELHVSILLNSKYCNITDKNNFSDNLLIIKVRVCVTSAYIYYCKITGTFCKFHRIMSRISLLRKMQVVALFLECVTVTKKGRGSWKNWHEPKIRPPNQLKLV